jgi:hypothetical protein
MGTETPTDGLLGQAMGYKLAIKELTDNTTTNKEAQAASTLE